MVLSKTSEIDIVLENVFRNGYSMKSTNIPVKLVLERIFVQICGHFQRQKLIREKICAFLPLVSLQNSNSAKMI